MDETPPEDFTDFDELKEKYCMLKRLYDEVIDSNSQMVLKLEEAKWTLSNSTIEQQEQNNELMSKNMELRKQKHYLSLEVRRLKSHIDVVKQLVNQALIEVDAQSTSMKRQENCLVDLHTVVSKLCQPNDGSNIPTASTNVNEVGSNAMMAPDILYEIKRSLKANCGRMVGLSPIQEETPGRKNAIITTLRRDSSVVPNQVQENEDVERKFDCIRDSVAYPGQVVHRPSSPQSRVRNTNEFTTLLGESKSAGSREQSPIYENNVELTGDKELASVNIVLAKNIDETARYVQQSSTNQLRDGMPWNSFASEYHRIAKKVSTIERSTLSSYRQVKVVDDNRLMVEVPVNDFTVGEGISMHARHSVSDSVDRYKLQNTASRDEQKMVTELNKSNSKFMSRDLTITDDENSVINQIHTVQEALSSKYQLENSTILMQEVTEDPTTVLQPQSNQISTSNQRPSVIEAPDVSPQISNDEPVQQAILRPKRRTNRLTFVKEEISTLSAESEEMPPRRVMTRARSKPRRDAMFENTEPNSIEVPPSNEATTKSRRTANKKTNSTEESSDFKVPVKKVRRKKCR